MLNLNDLKIKKMEINIHIEEYENVNELPEREQELVNQALGIIPNSYAPYSEFRVGAAVLLDNNEIVPGSNQENAAYPTGLCAERVALFYANSNYPGVPVKSIAIAASTNDGVTDDPIYPCGSCRQALMEIENLHNAPIRVLMIGRKKLQAVNSIHDLLPLSFDSRFLTKKKI